MKPFTDVRAIDKTKQIQQRNRRHNHKVNLQSELTLGDRIEVNEGLSISSTVLALATPRIML